MRISRRLFVVVLAEDLHGKSNLIQSLLAQGLGQTSRRRPRQQRTMVSPRGREIDAYVFVRAYQEQEKGRHRTLQRTLDSNDSGWRERELIIMPSHVDVDDVQQMIRVAQEAGFDVICAAVIMNNSDRSRCQAVWALSWEERWTIPNPPTGDWRGQVEALGRDLWTWICRALAA